jgi:tRNA U34 2-thiouridine synthase MnmA/TrmU
MNKNEAKVKLEKPVRAVTPGQTIVFSHKEKVLGAGIIK